MPRPVVLQVTGTDSGKYGSFERYLLEVAIECRERGYQTVMQAEAMPRPREYLRDLDAAGVQLEIIPSRRSALRSVQSCARLVARHRPTVINTHFVGPNWRFMAPVFGRMVGTRALVATVHNAMRDPSNSKARFYYGPYQHVLPVSDGVRTGLDISGVSPAKTSTVYLGLFGERQLDAAHGREVRRSLGLPERATVIGCIAWAAPWKGVDLLLHAFKEVIGSREDVYLLQIGVGEESVGLRQLAAELGVAHRVIWAGIVDEGWRLLNAADLYVQPSRSSEGLPFALMEAMALRLPVVCTRVSGNVEAVLDGRTGMVAEPEAQQLAAKIGALLDRPESWSEFGDAGHERYQQLFAGPASVDRLISDFYGIPKR